MKYYSYSRLFVLLVFLDYIITIATSGSLFFTLPSIFNTVSNLLYLLLFFIFSSLILYRFYNALFEKMYLFSISGFLMMFIGIAAMYLKRFISYPILQQIVFILFFISLIVLYCIILIPVIKNKYISDFDRGLYIFLFLIVVLPLINAILKSVITAYPIISIESYVSKLSSTAFLIFIFYYFFVVKNNIMIKNVISRRLIGIVASLAVILFCYLYIFNSDLIFRIIAAVFTNINVRFYLPFYIYVLAMAILIITFLIGIVFSDNTVIFIPLTLIILTGLNTTDFYIRVVSVFAVIDIADYVGLKCSSKYYNAQSDIIEKSYNVLT